MISNVRKESFINALCRAGATGVNLYSVIVATLGAVVLSLHRHMQRSLLDQRNLVLPMGFFFLCSDLKPTDADARL